MKTGSARFFPLPSCSLNGRALRCILLCDLLLRNTSWYNASTSGGSKEWASQKPSGSACIRRLFASLALFAMFLRNFGLFTKREKQLTASWAVRAVLFLMDETRTNSILSSSCGTFCLALGRFDIRPLLRQEGLKYRYWRPC